MPPCHDGSRETLIGGLPGPITQVMDNGIQAVAARITQLEQRFVAGAGTADASATTDGLSSQSFAAVLSAALGSSGLSTALGSENSSSGLDTTMLGGSGLGSGQGLSASALLSLLGLVGRSGSTVGAVGSGYGSYSTGSPSAVPGVGSGVGSSTLTPAARLAPGAYPKLSPPAELAAFGNGRIPTERLESIGVGSHKLYAPAAKAFTQMTAAAKAEGVTIGITDSYRTYDSQVDLAGRKGLYSQGGLAATPGTSNHGWGLATDLDLDATAQQWMRDNGWKYGFVEDTPREPWHWTYRPAAAV